MIAFCQPAECPRDVSQPEGSQWNGVPTSPSRTGSLRRIDEIVGELLAGYGVGSEPGEAGAVRSGRACMPAAVDAPARRLRVHRSRCSRPVRSDAVTGTWPLPFVMRTSRRVALSLSPLRCISPPCGGWR